jgi:hypothetical protein
VQFGRTSDLDRIQRILEIAMTALQDELKREILGSPCLFPMDRSTDGQWVHFIRLTEEDYRRASFMDRRMLSEAEALGQPFKSGNIPWPLFAPWTLELPVRCDFIFHISHAGSTMLARMLGEHPDCLSIREPWLLRSLVEPTSSDLIRGFLALWSRSFRPNQRSLIKATSFVSQIGERLMEHDSDSKAVLMYVPAETFLASVLDGSMSDIDSNAAARWARLPQHAAGSLALSELSPGQRAAMSWFAEMESLRHLHRLFPNRTLFLDFDAFLRDLPVHLKTVSQWLGLRGHESSMLESPTIQRYAKRLDVPYDSDFRRRLLEQSRVQHQAEIAKGLRWLEGTPSAGLTGPE